MNMRMDGLHHGNTITPVLIIHITLVSVTTDTNVPTSTSVEAGSIQVSYCRAITKTFNAGGSDASSNAVAAHADHGGDLIIIDFGTATTFDIVGHDGSYDGGIIAPGVNLSMEALHQAAAQLPRIAIERPQSVVGRDTIPAMQSGVFWGYIAMIEGLVARIKAEVGRPMKVLGTGGLANLFRHSTTAIDDIDGNLTIRGLRYIWERNAEAGCAPVEDDADHAEHP